MNLDKIQKELLLEVSSLDCTTNCNYNIRVNGKDTTNLTSKNIQLKKEDNKLEVIVLDNTKNETIYLPVLLSASNFKDQLQITFRIGKNCDVSVIGGCGINNCIKEKSQHDGLHFFNIDKNSRVFYQEKHIGRGANDSSRIINATTEIKLAENASLEMKLMQIEGLNSSKRITRAQISNNAKLKINETILTTKEERATSNTTIELNGENSAATINSRSLARKKSNQQISSLLIGNNKSTGHIVCDAIILDSAKVSSAPQLQANTSEAQLSHEAAISRIADEQIIKLMTLGLEKDEAEQVIIESLIS